MIHKGRKKPVRMRRPSLLLSAALAVASPGLAINPDTSWKPEASVPTPEKGQLVFVAGGDTDFSRAITSATALADGHAFDHVGIIDADSSGVWVIEATPQTGVVITPWSDFEAMSPRLLLVTVNDIDTAAAVERAREYVGTPYDWAYVPGADCIYCSELVQLCYLDSAGHPIFPSRPMNFLDEHGQLPEFWSKLFQKMEKPVPQGLPGTNPNDMARDALEFGRLSNIL